MPHLLGIEALSAADITQLLDSAVQFQRSPPRSSSPAAAAGKRIVVNLFFEASTRTRVSFEIASRRLGLEVVNWTAQGSSHEKGETLLDTVRNVVAMGPDALVVRHPSAGAAGYLSRQVEVPIVNAGDGAHEHPSQALLDAFTLRERLGTVAGRTITIVGDIAHSRVARSNVLCLTKLGAKVRLCGPLSLLPKGIEALGPPGTVAVFTDLSLALEGVHAVMALRIQRERLDGVGLPGVREYHRRYGLTRERIDAHARGALILHPGPINRGVEMSSEVADGEQSAILQQVENGVAVRMALLRWVLA